MDDEGREVGGTRAATKGNSHIVGKPAPWGSENCHASRKARVRRGKGG